MYQDILAISGSNREEYKGFGAKRITQMILQEPLISQRDGPMILHVYLASNAVSFLSVLIIHSTKKKNPK